MSAFMRRFAQYIDAEDGTPAQADNATNADNAETLDGFTASQLTSRAAFNSTIDAPDGADFTLSTTITAPAPGILLLSATIDATNITDVNFYQCFLEIDDGLVSGTYMFAQLDGDTNANWEEDCTTTGAAVVAAGTHTIDFEVEDVRPSTLLFDASVWVLWVPLDGGGAIPSSVTQLGQTRSSIDEKPTDDERPTD